MLELAILGLLIESPMHGYELRKRLTGLLGAFRAFSYGSLYPALRRMQADALIAENAAPAGTPVRRARRVYELTDAGRRRFGELVADTGPHNYTDDGFGVHLAFFNRTPAGADAHLGGPPPSGRGTPGRSARSGGPCQQLVRPLHPTASSTRSRIQRARSQVAQRADRRGAGSGTDVKPRMPPRTPNRQDNPRQQLMELGERPMSEQTRRRRRPKYESP